jgi:integrase
VLAAIKGHSLYPVATLALFTGCRRGELCGLQWSDADLDRGVLRIERSVEETKAGLRVKQPKTRAGRRNVALSPEAVTLLKEHRREQLELRMALGAGRPSLVFGTIEDELRSPNAISRDWLRLLKRRGLPHVSFHSLRHTSASMMIAAGVDILTVSRRLGHRKASVTLDVYGHLIEGKDAEAANAIEGLLK